MEVAVDCSLVDDAGVGVAFVDVKAGVGVGVKRLGCLRWNRGGWLGVGDVVVVDAVLGTVGVAGARVLAGNGAVAAPDPGADAAVDIKVTVDSGVYVRASSWAGVGPSQARRDARVTGSPEPL